MKPPYFGYFDLDRKSDAETTKMELAENIARGKKIILGIDTEINGTRHMIFLAKRYGIKKVHTSMEGCLAELKGYREEFDLYSLNHINLLFENF